MLNFISKVQNDHFSTEPETQQELALKSVYGYQKQITTCKPTLSKWFCKIQNVMIQLHLNEEDLSIRIDEIAVLNLKSPLL